MITNQWIKTIDGVDAESRPPSVNSVRIGIISPYSLTVPGGVQSQVIGLANSLSGLGHKTRILAPCDGAPPEKGITPLGASIPTFANGSVAPIAPDLACTLRTIRALRDETFDVVHVHEPICPGPCQTALFLKNAPIVGTWHAAGGSKAYRTPGVEWLASRMEVRVAVSEDAREMAEQALGGSYEVAFNGIEFEKFQEIDAAESPQPTIAYVGRHEPRKGLETLLQALKTMPDEVKLWVMSEGPQTVELKSRYGKDPRIQWLGSVTDEEKISRLKGADVFCVPSLRGESFGIVLLEGMAAGTPIVASNIAGYRNVATHEEHAELVEPGSPDLLATALTRVLKDRKYAESLVSAGHKRASEFSMDRLAELYVRYYQVAINQAQKATQKPSRWGELIKFGSS